MNKTLSLIEEENENDDDFNTNEEEAFGNTSSAHQDSLKNISDRNEEEF